MKRRRWKWVLGLTGGLLLVAGIVVADAHRRAANTFASHEREIARTIELIRSRDASRPTLGDSQIPGNAWTYYKQAFDELSALSVEEAAAIPEIDLLLEEGDLPDDHLLHGIFAAHASGIALMEQGTSCRIVEPGYDYEAGDSMSVALITETMRGARFLTGSLAHHHRIGESAESLRLSLIGLAMAQDIGRKGPLIAIMIQWVNEGIIQEGLRQILLDGHGFSRADLERFVRELDGLEAHRPRLADAWEPEDVVVRQTLIRAEWKAFDRASKWGTQTPVLSWRCFFSQRITRAQAVNVWSQMIGRIKGLSGLPLQVRLTEAKKLSDEYQSHSNPLVAQIVPSLSRLYVREAVTLLGRTLLRISIAIARFQLDRGVDPPSLEALVPNYLSEVPPCPLTAQPLRYRDGRVWSVGANGIDDGGIEDLSVSPGDGGDGDVVWTVRRK